jgi:hypothetical protein
MINVIECFGERQNKHFQNFLLFAFFDRFSKIAIGSENGLFLADDVEQGDQGSML